MSTLNGTLLQLSTFTQCARDIVELGCWRHFYSTWDVTKKTLDSEQPATGEMTLVNPDHSFALVEWEYVKMTSQELAAAHISGNVLQDPQGTKRPPGGPPHDEAGPSNYQRQSSPWVNSKGKQPEGQQLQAHQAMAILPKSERSKGKQPERRERNEERPEDPQPRSQESKADSDVDMVDDHDLPESSGSTNIAGNARLKSPRLSSLHLGKDQSI